MSEGKIELPEPAGEATGAGRVSMYANLAPGARLYTATQVRQAIAEAVAAERERCARVCDEIASAKRMHARQEADDGEHGVATMLQWKVDGAIDCAAAIRRGPV